MSTAEHDDRARAADAIRSAAQPLYGVVPGLDELVDRTTALLEDRSATAPPRPVLDHVGIAVTDLAAAADFFVTGLSGRVIAGGNHTAEGIRTLHIALPGGGKIELLQPLGEGGVASFIAGRGEGVHHLTVLVDDVEEIAKRLEATGCRIVGMSTEDPEWHEAYISPRTAYGCLIQLVRPGDGFGRPVADLTVEDVLADRWEWAGRAPVRR